MSAVIKDGGSLVVKVDLMDNAVLLSNSISVLALT